MTSKALSTNASVAKNQNPEQIGRDRIDRMLMDAGWIVQSKELIDFSAEKRIGKISYFGKNLISMTKKLALQAILCFLLISCHLSKKSSPTNMPVQPIEAVAITGSDTLIVTTRQAPIREKPDVNSIQLLEVGADSLLITHEKAGNYYKVVIGNKVGYLPIAFAKPLSIVSSPPREVVNENPTRSTLSTKKCPSVQCSGYTKKRTRCRNRTTNCSGRCYLH